MVTKTQGLEGALAGMPWRRGGNSLKPSVEPPSRSVDTGGNVLAKARSELPGAVSPGGVGSAASSPEAPAGVPTPAPRAKTGNNTGRFGSRTTTAAKPSLADSLAFARPRTATTKAESFADSIARAAALQQALESAVGAPSGGERLGRLATAAMRGGSSGVEEQRRALDAEQMAKVKQLQGILTTQAGTDAAYQKNRLASAKFLYEQAQQKDKGVTDAIERFTADPDERALLTLDYVQHFQGPQSDEGMTSAERDAIIAGLYQKGREEGRYRPHQKEAPKTRTYQRGAETVTEEFDPATGAWKELAAGPKWDPSSGGGGQLTPTQIANNQEIDEARAQLDRMLQQLPEGQTLSQELQRLMTKQDPLTGRPILDHNSIWGRYAWLARQAKVGGDPDSARWSKLVAELPPPPEATVPVGVSAPAGAQVTVPIQTATPPPEAIQMLIANPSLRSFFDSKYGTGTSDLYLGR